MKPIRYTNVSKEQACKMYHQWYRLWYSVSAGYFVALPDGEEASLPEDASRWPPTVELTPTEMQRYLDEITAVPQEA